jgi:hypothetical protein
MRVALVRRREWVPKKLGSTPMLAIHWETSRAYCRVCGRCRANLELGEKIPTRGGGDRGARGFLSYHPRHLCAAPQAQTDIPVAAIQTLIDLFAEVVRSAIQQRSGSLCPSRRRTRQCQPCVDCVFSCARHVQQEETAHEADVLVEVHHVHEAVGARHRPIRMTN